MAPGTLVLPFNEDIAQKRKEIEARINESKTNLENAKAELTNLQKECPHPKDEEEDTSSDLYGSHHQCKLCGHSYYRR